MPGELIVKLKNDASRGPGVLSLNLAGVSILSAQVFQTDSRLMKIKISDESRLQSALQSLQQDPRVEYVEPNYIYRMSASGIPDDPMMPKLWNLINEGQKDSGGNKGKPGADVRVAPVWASGNVGSRNVVVAVIDTGIDWKHEDLKANLFVNPGESGSLANNGKDDDKNGFIDDTHGWNFEAKSRKSSDDQGHGTHCAGTIGGAGNNRRGVAGVNWEVTLMPVKFLDSNGSGTLEAAVESINYATMMKVNIMSNSWGGGGFSQALLESIQKARDAGILFVAAAGNDGRDNDSSNTYPANYDVENVVSVAALDNQDNLASFSNYGRTKVHVAAPGVNILSTKKDGGYEVLSGTSMACP
ncbi:MAG: S8 family peptidase, partial [Oligoflexia bacterium]